MEKIQDQEKRSIRVRSLTEACVSLSKNIVIAKAAQISNRQTQFLCNRIPPFIPDAKKLDELNKSLDVRKHGYKLDIGKYLKEILFNSIHYDILLERNDIKVLMGDINAKFNFSTDDLRSGYVAFIREQSDKELIDFILVLNDKTELSVGEIYTFKEAEHVLTNLKDSTVKNCAAYIYSAKKLKDDEPTET